MLSTRGKKHFSDFTSRKIKLFRDNSIATFTEKYPAAKDTTPNKTEGNFGSSES